MTKRTMILALLRDAGIKATQERVENLLKLVRRR